MNADLPTMVSCDGVKLLNAAESRLYAIFIFPKGRLWLGTIPRWMMVWPISRVSGLRCGNGTLFSLS